MAGEFDDLLPGGTPPKPSGATLGEFTDLVPTPEQAAADKRRKVALAAKKAIEGEPGIGDIFSDAFTLGLMKPTAGLAQGASDWATGRGGFGEGYQTGVGAYDDYLNEARKKAGWAGTGADLAGSVFSVGGTGATRFWPMIAQAAGIGAVEGGARNSESVGGALKGAAMGAGLGAAGGAAMHGILRNLPGARRERALERERNRGVPGEDLRTEARAAFKQLDDAGIAYSDKQAGDLADAVQQDLTARGYDPAGVHKTLEGVVGRLEGLRGQPVSLETLQHIREQVASNAGSIDPQVRRIAGGILRQIDGFVTTVDPPLGSMVGSEVGPLWQRARRLWRTAAVADDISWRLDKASRRSASTNSGTNIENPIRQNIRSVMDKAEQPGRYNPYSPAELQQMGRVVEGTPVRNFLRATGNRLGGSGPLGMATDVGGGMLAGATSLLHGAEPTTTLLATTGAGAGLWGAGKLARQQADRMAEDEADTLVRLISTGSKAAPAAIQGPPTREALARLIMPGNIARGAGAALGRLPALFSGGGQ